MVQRFECLHRILNDQNGKDLDVGILTYHTRYDEKGNKVSDEPYSRRYNISSGIGYDAAISEQVQRSPMEESL